MEDKFIGCFLGLALGDAMCAPYEGGVAERFLWRMIGRTKAGELRFTDDTQMALDIARSFLRDGEINQDKLAREFSESYKWSRGYGPGAGKILKKIRRGLPWNQANISVYKDGSFGNGAAMRAPILAMCFMPSSPEFKQGVIRSSEITHAHALAIEGALLVAYSVSHALSDMPDSELCRYLIECADSEIFRSKLQLCRQHLQNKTELKSNDVKKAFGNGMTAKGSCVTAIYLAIRFRDKPFMDLLSFIKKLGGDTDTIAAMAGAIWGASNGAKRLQLEDLPRIEMQNEIQKIAIKLHATMNLDKNK